MNESRIFYYHWRIAMCLITNPLNNEGKSMGLYFTLIFALHLHPTSSITLEKHLGTPMYIYLSC